MFNTILLATFTKEHKVKYTVEKIKEQFEVVSGKIFVLKDVDNPFNRIITFNIEKKADLRFDETLKNTVSLHRKKDYNVLYSLNALNEVIKKQNGSLDKNFAVNWDGYMNSILLLSNKEEGKDPELKQIRTKLIKTIEV